MPDQTLSLFLPLIVMIGASYFFLIRPQKKREQDAQKMRDNLKVGSKVITIGGIKGKIMEIDEDDVVIAGENERTRLRMTKSSIYTQIPDDLDEYEEEEPIED